MDLTRRQALTATSALFISALGFSRLTLADSPAVGALGKSQLIYLTPIKSNGEESACHGEVWFVQHGEQIYVVTQADAWRAEAVRKGLKRASIWIGEFGVWKRAKDKYRSAPFLRLEGELENDRGVHKTLLDKFGVKYSNEWSSWGPRFREGLANGSRVMLRYQITS